MARDLTDPAARRQALAEDLRAAAQAALEIVDCPQGGAYTHNPTVVTDPGSPAWLRAEVERLPLLARSVSTLAVTAGMTARRLADHLDRSDELETHLGVLAARVTALAASTGRASDDRIAANEAAVRTLAHALAELRSVRTREAQRAQAHRDGIQRAMHLLLALAVTALAAGLLGLVLAAAAVWL